MAKLIVDGAQMHCTLGMKDAPIKVTSHSFVKISGALVATEADKVGMVNIPTFGTCRCGSPDPPCVPQFQGWQQTVRKDNINGMKKLTQQSFCTCARGGRITFVDTGKNAFVGSK